MNHSRDASFLSISTALRAYAAGDAFGVAYEFRDFDVVTDELLSLEGWPYGGVSDDSLLTLLTLATLNSSPKIAAAEFLKSLHSAAPSLRGLGPTTRHALGMSVKESEVHLIGKSNGGMMRTALSGLAFDLEDSQSRRDFVNESVRTTHFADEAVIGAQIAAALFAQAVAGSGATMSEIIEQEIAADINLSVELRDRLTSRESWTPPTEGISLDPIETLFAFTFVADRNTTVLGAYKDACRLKGDTDTVSALAGSLVAARFGEASQFQSIPWLDDIQWDEISALDSIIELVYRKRKLR